MENNKKIIWLASYPKSGNTWFRIFLANLFSCSNQPTNINELQETSIASNRQMFDEVAGIASSDLTPQEIESLRPSVYDKLAENSVQPIFLKIHDAFIYTAEKRPLISENASFKALYFIRNPLDIAVSFKHHLAVSYEKSVQILNDENYAFCSKNNRLHNQLEQKILSWSGHVKSWTHQTVLPIFVLRYEDMLADTHFYFHKALEFLDLKFNDKIIRKSIEYSDFKELQKQEKEKGFKEKAPEAELFFRSGYCGTWQKELSRSLVKKVISEHFEIMKLFNYIDNQGNPK